MDSEETKERETKGLAGLEALNESEEEDRDIEEQRRTAERSGDDETSGIVPTLSFFGPKQRKTVSTLAAIFRRVELTESESTAQDDGLTRPREDEDIDADDAILAASLDEEISPGAFLFENGTFRPAVEANAGLAEPSLWHTRGISQTVTTSPAALVRATPVSEEPPQSIPRAEPARPHVPNNNTSCWCAFKVVGVLVATIVSTYVILVLTVWQLNREQPGCSGCHDGGKQDSPLSRENYMISLLPHTAVNRIDLTTYNRTTGQSKSPQTMAFNWTVQDPHFEKYIDEREGSWRLLQRYALACFFFSTGGETTWHEKNNWLDYEIDETRWFRSNTEDPTAQSSELSSALGMLGNTYTMHGDGEEFQHLWLHENGLEGRIPPELCLLSSLRSISIGDNLLMGSIPSEVGCLTHLQILTFPNTTLTGLPTEIGQLSNLIVLVTVNNTLDATIPSEIGQLPLFWLGLSNAGINGAIPSEIGLSTMLLAGLWEKNNIASTIPSEIGKITTLRYLDLSANELQGTIPSEVGLLLKVRV